MWQAEMKSFLGGISKIKDKVLFHVLPLQKSQLFSDGKGVFILWYGIFQSAQKQSPA